MRIKREKRHGEIFFKKGEQFRSLSKDTLHIAGLFLYWGEGAKTRMDRIALTNSDPKMMAFFIWWLRTYYRVSDSRIRARIHIYSDMNEQEELRYWRNVLNLPDSNFTKTYVKTSYRSNINHKGSYQHGTCEVCLCDSRLAEDVLISIRALKDSTNCIFPKVQI